MKLRCWFGVHTLRHPVASSDGALVATCESCGRTRRIDLWSAAKGEPSIGRPKVTQVGDRPRQRIARTWVHGLRRVR
jgi:hypothetical protein